MADILVVEDDPSVSNILTMLLEMEGHTTRAAANGLEALLQLRDKHPDLTISDIEMPVLDGPSLCTRMMVEDQGMERIPILLISGFPELERLAHEVGTPYYSGKPFQIEALLQLVRRALKERIPPIPFTHRYRTQASG
jgi:CheY-like chemotaxis protein